MFYQALPVRDCRSRAEILATYKTARQNILANGLPALPAPPVEDDPQPLPPPTSIRPDIGEPVHMAAILTLVPVDEAKMPAATIISAVASAHGVSMADMKGHRRASRFVAARHHAVALLAQFRPDLSFPVIGMLMNRDHSTIIYGKRHWPKIAGRYRTQAARVENMIGIRWERKNCSIPVQNS